MSTVAGCAAAHSARLATKCPVEFRRAWVRVGAIAALAPIHRASPQAEAVVLPIRAASTLTPSTRQVPLPAVFAERAANRGVGVRLSRAERTLGTTPTDGVFAPHIGVNRPRPGSAESAPFTPAFQPHPTMHVGQALRLGSPRPHA
jgi:hypothetical protein